MAMLVVSTMLVSLYAGFSSGFAIVGLSRENLRATQILVQKTEAVRIFNWRQITSGTLLKTNFTDYYNPAGLTNNTEGASYQGTVNVSSAGPSSVPADYQNKMRTITVTLFWTNYVGHSSTVIVRSRQMQTYVARYGMQDYIYR